MRLLSDWEFWSAVTAVVAIVLSQIPPISQLVRRAKLTTEVYRYVLLGHLVGYPQMKFSIGISNTGGQEAKITDITITLSRDGKVVATLPAQMYSPETEPSKQILFAGFKIKPNEDRNYIFHFFADLSRDQASDLNEKTSVLMKDIEAKKEARGPNFGPPVYIEADADNVTPFQQMLKENFIWNRGDYVMNVLVQSSSAKIAVEKKYRFTLFESDSKKLHDYEKRYKYGEGIYYGTENQWSWIKIDKT